jgi:hypothetical protein
MKSARWYTTLDDMHIRKNFIAPLLLAAGAAAAIAAAPTAMAANTDPAPVFPHDHTTLVGPSPGNNQINNASPPADFAPQYPYWEGDSGGYFGGYGHGGFAGGFGGGHGGGGHR